MIIYEIGAYQENGFASSEWSEGFYLDKAKAIEKCRKLNETHKNTMYKVYERELVT